MKTGYYSSTYTDAEGNVIQRNLYDVNGLTTKIIDAAGFLSDFSDSGRYGIEYTYDYAGNLTSVTDGNGENINYYYNMDNNLVMKNVEGKDEVERYFYNKDGSLLAAASSSGIDMFEYTPEGYLDSKVRNGRMELQYEYNKNGFITEITDGTGETTDYIYDTLGRLKKVLNSTDEVASYSYNVDDTVAQIDYNNGIKVLYEYNRDKRITSIMQKNEYDAFSLRIASIENEQRYDFICDRDNIIAESDINYELVSRSIRGLGLIAQIDEAGTVNYYLHNAHGDVVSLVDSEGSILNSYTYDAFGNTLDQIETIHNRFMYSCEQFDKVTGQYYLRARYYSPGMGRFITEDTCWGKATDPLSLNLYTYCGNNPVLCFL